MLVKSFLALPKGNKLTQLSNYISTFENCEVTAPTNRNDVLVVVMENTDKRTEDQTLLKLHESDYLEHMVLVSSFNAEEN